MGKKLAEEQTVQDAGAQQDETPTGYETPGGSRAKQRNSAPGKSLRNQKPKP